MRVIVAMAALALVLGGCSSTSLHGDASLDPGPDRTDGPVDVVVDPDPDPAADVPVDWETDTSTCVPGGDGVWFEWELRPATYEDVDIPCRVLHVEPGDMGETLIDLECGTGGLMRNFQVEIFSNPHLYMEFLEGEEVMFHYEVNSWEWEEEWFAIRYYDGTTLVAGVTAASLAPYEHEVDEWYFPLSMFLATGLCPAEEDGCGPRERAAIDVTYWDAHGLVFDSNSASIGVLATVHVIVDTAWYYEEMGCLDHPDRYVSALFVLPPEG